MISHNLYYVVQKRSGVYWRKGIERNTNLKERRHFRMRKYNQDRGKKGSIWETMGSFL